MTTGLDQVVKVMSACMDVCSALGEMMDTNFDREDIAELLDLQVGVTAEIAARLSKDMTPEQAEYFQREVEIVQGGKALTLEAEQVLKDY